MKRTSFNADWRVRPKVSHFLELLGGGAAPWEPVTLPHDAMIGGRRDPAEHWGNGFFPGGVWQYEKTFVADDELRGQRVLLEFEGVYRGASVWVNGSYDPDLNLTYWGIGNAGPDYNGDARLGDNLYTSSVVALDADTGQLKWHYQFSPHDEFDYDAVQVPVLGDMTWNGSPRKVMMFANRNGFFYVLDRGTGKFLLGKPFVRVNWADGFDENGRPRRVPGQVPTPTGTLIYPGNQGGTNWYNPSFSPRTGLFYIPTWANYSSVYLKRPSEFVEGSTFNSGMARNTVPQGLRVGTVGYRSEDEGYGAVRAIDPHTGELKWEFKMTEFTDAGILTTASDLLFTGGREGYFFALNARTGAILWRFTVGGNVASGPMTYSVNGRQYVAVAAGSSLFAFALRQP